MAKYDYQCDTCQVIYEDISQDIGSDALPTCPEGHEWQRLIVGVKLSPFWGVRQSTSPQIEAFWSDDEKYGGDAEACFGESSDIPRHLPADIA